MNTEHTNSTSKNFTTISLLFGIAFIVIGVLNVLLVHTVPGIFYLLLSFAYFPFFDIFLSQKLGFKIPLVAKIVVGFIVMWGTLAVGDLAEMFGL